MQTIRQIERLWQNKQYDRLARELLFARPEYSPRLVVELSKPLACAALTLIRLDELSQSFHALNRVLIHYILGRQDSEGGWGDPLVTALCTRALLASSGNGTAVDRAIASLAQLQKPQGIWPSQNVRRLPADPYVSALILFYLGTQDAFASAIPTDQACDWFAAHPEQLDDQTRQLWQKVARRLVFTRQTQPAGN